MSFEDSSILIYDNTTNDIISFKESISTPYTLSLAPSQDKVLSYIVKRAGYIAYLGTFTSGGSISLSPTVLEKKDPNGKLSYTEITDENITISLSFLPQACCFIDIGNNNASSEAIVNMIENVLITEDGCKFLSLTNGSECLQTSLGGQNYLLLGSNYRLRRREVTDVNAAVDSYVISADGVAIDGSNGDIKFLQTSEMNLDVWNAVLSEYQVEGSMGKTMHNILTSSKMALAMSA